MVIYNIIYNNSFGQITYASIYLIYPKISCLYINFLSNSYSCSALSTSDF